jgi:hypothetical protein
MERLSYRTWRANMQYIIRQPNGKFAMFDKRTVDLSLDMGVGEVKQSFQYIRDRSYSAVESEMQDAKAERPVDFGVIDMGDTKIARPAGSRWNEVMALVQAVHGEEEMRGYLTEAGCPDFKLSPVSAKFQEQIDVFIGWFQDMEKAVEEREADRRTSPGV